MRGTASASRYSAVLPTWSSGGIASDIGNKISGMRGRLIAQSVCLIGEGILLLCGHQEALKEAKKAENVRPARERLGAKLPP